MTNIPAYLRVKFGEEVWHDESYDGHPTDFFDRLPAKEQALAILRSPQTQRAIWLIGERRAGKSSLLKLLLEKCRKEKFLAIEVPWQSIHSSDNFYKEFLSQLDGAIGSTSNAPAEPGTSFWDALHERQQKIGQRTLVVGIDEIDSILLEQVDENSRKEILDCLWRLITQELNTKIILTSARPSNRIEHLKASPLVSKSQGIFVQTFPDADLHELIRSLVSDVSDAEIAQIKTMSGRWPYYAKSILYHLLQSATDSHRLEQARSAAVKSIAQTCEHLYRHHWDGNEQRALWLLVNKEQIKPEEFKQLDTSVRTAFLELTQRGYVLEENGRYRFCVLLIADWLKGWTRREIEEEKLEIPLFLKKLINPWAKEPGEQSIQITKEDLRRRGF